MKTTKLILGILSGVFFIIIALQSCAVTVGDALADNGGSGGFGGIMLAFCVLIGGVVGAAARSSKAGSIVAAVFLPLRSFLRPYLRAASVILQCGRPSVLHSECSS